MSIDRQFELEDPQGGAKLVCWLKDSAILTVGVRVTLKETADLPWRVTRRYQVTVNTQLNRHWHLRGYHGGANRDEGSSKSE